MVGELAARHALSKEVVEGVSERTGGVPLFVEEVTRLLLERGVEGGARAIPPTLQQSLAARLDRLGSAREVAQIGAVLGRDFTNALLHAVGGLEEPALQSALDRLAGADLLIAQGTGPQANYRFKHALIQDAAYDSLLKSRRKALHRRAAEILVGRPEPAAAEPEVIAHHFTEAGLDELAIEWWGKAGDQALRRSAFQEAIAHLGKAIAVTDKGGGVSSERRHLQVAYGNALFHARGYGAPETAEAFAKARESALGDKGASERLKIDYGLWAGNFARGQLQSMRAHAAAFLRDVSDRPDSPEAGVAHRCAGTTHLFAGEYQEARVHLEQALALFQPGRDDDLADRFGQDAGISAMLYLALVLWPIGDAERAISLVRDAKARTATITHIGARAYGMCLAAMFELVCGNLSRAAPHAAELARLAHEHDLLMWQAYGIFLEGATKVEGRTLGGGLRDMRRGAELLREQKVRTFDGLAKITLAEAEARAGDIDRAAAILDEALATCARTGHRQFDAELHRARGEMLLKRGPANPTAAEEAFQTAITVAKQQGTRSFELRALLALAKLLQSTGRSVEAHAVLIPALESFSPTPEMPEIAEARALLAALAETDEVKSAYAARQRRLHLQTQYGQAVMWSKGFAADETEAAFARASEFAGSAGDAPERLIAYYAQCLRGMVRGEYGQAREIAETFLREAEAHRRPTEAAAARRMLGLILLNRGELKAARSVLECALGNTASQRDGETPFLFDWDTDGEASAAAYLALAEWHLGEIERARQLIQLAIRRADKLGHIATVANVLFFKTVLESRRQDVSATQQAAEALLRLTKERGIKSFVDMVQLYVNWTHGRLVDPEEGAGAIRVALAAHVAAGNKGAVLSHHVLLAELEATTHNSDNALTLVGEGLAIAKEIGGHLFDPHLHRLRGDILLKRNPADLAAADEPITPLSRSLSNKALVATDFWPR
jgi:predicted ATPase